MAPISTTKRKAATTTVFRKVSDHHRPGTRKRKKNLAFKEGRKKKGKAVLAPRGEKKKRILSSQKGRPLPLQKRGGQSTSPRSKGKREGQSIRLIRSFGYYGKGITNFTDIQKKKRRDADGAFRGKKKKRRSIFSRGFCGRKGDMNFF